MTIQQRLSRGMAAFAALTHAGAFLYVYVYVQSQIQLDSVQHDCIARGIAGLFTFLLAVLLTINLGIGSSMFVTLKRTLRSGDAALLWASAATAAGPPLLLVVGFVHPMLDLWYPAALVYPHLLCASLSAACPSASASELAAWLPAVRRRSKSSQSSCRR